MFVSKLDLFLGSVEPLANSQFSTSVSLAGSLILALFELERLPESLGNSLLLS